MTFHRLRQLLNWLLKVAQFVAFWKWIPTILLKDLWLSTQGKISCPPHFMATLKQQEEDTLYQMKRDILVRNNLTIHHSLRSENHWERSIDFLLDDNKDARRTAVYIILFFVPDQIFAEMPLLPRRKLFPVDSDFEPQPETPESMTTASTFLSYLIAHPERALAQIIANKTARIIALAFIIYVFLPDLHRLPKLPLLVNFITLQMSFFLTNGSSMKLFVFAWSQSSISSALIPLQISSAAHSQISVITSKMEVPSFERLKFCTTCL
jgi:hypothetical protein